MNDSWESTQKRLSEWQKDPQHSAWQLRRILSDSKYYIRILMCAALRATNRPAQVSWQDWWAFHLERLSEKEAIDLLLTVWNKDIRAHISREVVSHSEQIIQSMQQSAQIQIEFANSFDAFFHSIQPENENESLKNSLTEANNLKGEKDLPLQESSHLALTQWPKIEWDSASETDDQKSEPQERTQKDLDIKSSLQNHPGEQQKEYKKNNIEDVKMPLLEDQTERLLLQNATRNPITGFEEKILKNAWFASAMLINSTPSLCPPHSVQLQKNNKSRTSSSKRAIGRWVESHIRQWVMVSKCALETQIGVMKKTNLWHLSLSFAIMKCTVSGPHVGFNSGSEKTKGSGKFNLFNLNPIIESAQVGAPARLGELKHANHLHESAVSKDTNSAELGQLDQQDSREETHRSNPTGGSKLVNNQKGDL